MKLTKIEILLVVLALLSASFTIAGASMSEDASALDSPGAYHPPSWEPGPIAYPPPYLIAPTHFPWDKMPTLPPQSNRYNNGLPHVPPPFQRPADPDQGANSGNDNSLEFGGGKPDKP
jgi:hypothetical protein